MKKRSFFYSILSFRTLFEVKKGAEREFYEVRNFYFIFDQ